MGITIPELPPADFNKELRLVLTDNRSYTASQVARLVDLDALSRVGQPVILVQDMSDNRTKKVVIEDLIKHIQSKVKDHSEETLNEALQLLYQISLADRLPLNLQHELESFLWRHYDRDNL